MNSDEIVNALSVLTERERANYVVVYSAALVLCGANILAKDVNLQALTEEGFLHSWASRQMIPTITSQKPISTIHLSPKVEATYSKVGDDCLHVQPYGTKENIFSITKGVLHLSPFGCMRWYHLAIEQSNNEKDHIMMKIAMDLYYKSKHTDVLIEGGAVV